MTRIAVRLLLVSAMIAFPSITLAQNSGESFAAIQPPTIYVSNTQYPATAASSAPSNATITVIYWQLQWDLSNGADGMPSGMQMIICDAENNCTLITNPTSRGNTSYFQGESANQTFTVTFEIKTAHTVVLIPAYIGVSANSGLLVNYTD
jgi:hypothetical protein